MRVEHMLVSAGLGSWLIGQFDLDNLGESVRLVRPTRMATLQTYSNKQA